MTTMVEMGEKYLQDYLTAKHRGELPPKVFFNQSSNKGKQLTLVNGKLGMGAYARGTTVDRNTQDTPENYQHSTDPKLILGISDFDGDIEKASNAGYVGVEYEQGKYFLFPDSVNGKEANRKESFTHRHPITDKVTTPYKVGKRWRIDGVNKDFRNKQAAINHLEKDLKILLGRNQRRQPNA